MKSDKEAQLRLYRLIDANLNRLREGIRVVEDIYRYIYNDKTVAAKLKNIRHKARYENEKLIAARDIAGDVLKKSIQSEHEREDLNSIITANIKRAQESARVLEEALKLVDIEASEKFKTIRYELYDIEITLRKNRRFD
jgi:thiamine-phosphate pyrophosphorylase